MADQKNHFPSTIWHGVEIHEDYICLFKSNYKNHVKFLTLEQKHLDEAAEACDDFAIDSVERAGAFRDIVDYRVDDWSEILTSEFFLDSFTEEVYNHEKAYAQKLMGSFEDFMDAYETYWDAANEDISRTPFDEAPSEEALRERHRELSAYLARHL
jgi:hypothetical protein